MKESAKGRFFENYKQESPLICQLIEPFAEKLRQELLLGCIWPMWCPTILPPCKSSKTCSGILLKVCQVDTLQVTYIQELQCHLEAESRSTAKYALNCIWGRVFTMLPLYVFLPLVYWMFAYCIPALIYHSWTNTTKYFQKCKVLWSVHAF